MKAITSLAAVITIFLYLANISTSRTLKDRSIRRSRMVRGKDAELDEWSFVVNLNFHQENPKWKICGGALIHQKWVLTAAHCLEDIPNEPKSVSVTTGRGRKITGHTRTYKVDKIIIYEQYLVVNSKMNISAAKDFNWDYDIALLRLEKAIEHPSTIARLPNKELLISEMSEVKCKSAGWGSLKEYERDVDVKRQHYIPATELQEIDVPIISRNNCRSVHNNEVTDLVFCGGQLRKEAMTSCIGDSGSPLICSIANSNQSMLAGIVIGGNSFCKTGNEYMMFTDVARYRQWIDNKLRN